MSKTHLSWSSSSDAVGVTNYLIERRPDENSAFVQIDTSATNSYDDTGLTDDHVYGYRVRATDAASNLSGYSGIINVPTYLHSDNFNRSDGAIGTGWAAIPEGSMVISSNKATGTTPGVLVGNYRTETYADDQYSEITIPFSPADVIAVSVRNQSGGTGYFGFYVWNGGSPLLKISKRTGGSYSVLVSVSSPVLPNGTRLRLIVIGSSLALMVNGVEKCSIYDTSISTGAPGIGAASLDAVDNWGGGTQRFEAHYVSTDSDGIETYTMFSSGSGGALHTLRILRPTSPAPGVDHNFIWAMPVVQDLNYFYGDAVATIKGLDAHNQYNVTVIAPSFHIEPWYGNHATNQRIQYESFMVNELRPWVKANVAQTFTEQHWMFSFSKSAFGALDLIFKHPALFDLVAAWDFPAMGMVLYNTFGADPNYGTDANYQANYRITTTFLDTYKTPFLSDLRIWIQGYKFWQTEVDDFHTALTSKSILHTYSSISRANHSWDEGWAPAALDALYNMSLAL